MCWLCWKASLKPYTIFINLNSYSVYFRFFLGLARCKFLLSKIEFVSARPRIFVAGPWLFWWGSWWSSSCLSCSSSPWTRCRASCSSWQSWCSALWLECTTSWPSQLAWTRHLPPQSLVLRPFQSRGPGTSLGAQWWWRPLWPARSLGRTAWPRSQARWPR